jgi:hypothetical protein
MTPTLVKDLLLLHSGIYVLLAVVFAVALYQRGGDIYPDDRGQMEFWETRLPSMMFWLIAWEVTLFFTPWFYKRLVEGSHPIQTFSLSVGIFIATLAAIWFAVVFLLPPKQTMFYSFGPPQPSPHELYCQHVRAFNLTQPPHQQVFGIGCP